MFKKHKVNTILTFLSINSTTIFGGDCGVIFYPSICNWILICQIEWKDLKHLTIVIIHDFDVVILWHMFQPFQNWPSKFYLCNFDGYLQSQRFFLKFYSWYPSNSLSSYSYHVRWYDFYEIQTSPSFYLGCWSWGLLRAATRSCQLGLTVNYFDALPLFFISTQILLIFWFSSKVQISFLKMRIFL